MPQHLGHDLDTIRVGHAENLARDPPRVRQRAEDVEHRRDAELGANRPEGLRYASFRLADGVSFVHISATDTADGTNPLTETDAFAEFLREIGDRCAVAPAATEAAVVGSYRCFEDATHG